MSKSTTENRELSEKHQSSADGDVDPNAQFGGLEARKKLEKKLLLKVDARMSILLLIYILNYVSSSYVSS